MAEDKQDIPPTAYADRVQQHNPDGKQRWGDPRPQKERTPWDLMTVPINFSTYGLDSNQLTTTSEIKQEPSHSGLSKLKSVFSSSSSSKKDDLKPIVMTRDEYTKYWIKGKDGNFAEGVTEPPGGRAEWLKNQWELSEKYRQQEKEFKKNMHKIPQGENTLSWMVKEAQDVMDW